MEDWAITSRSRAEPPYPFHKPSYPFGTSKVDSTYAIEPSDEAILSIYAEERARKQWARFEESKEETKEEDDDELGSRFQTSFARARYEESREETKEEDDELDHGFTQCLDYYDPDESKEESKEEDDELHNGCNECLDYYEEDLEIDPAVVLAGSGNFQIVNYEAYSPPPISWIIQAMYNARQDLLFKIKTPQGAYMLLYADEIIDCALILIDDDDGSTTYFQIEDLYGNILFADGDQVEAHILYIISTETRKRQATVDVVDRDTLFQNAKPKRRRKHSGPLVTGFRKLSELVRQRRASSRST